MDAEHGVSTGVNVDGAAELVQVVLLQPRLFPPEDVFCCFGVCLLQSKNLAVERRDAADHGDGATRLLIHHRPPVPDQLLVQMLHR